MAVSGETWLAVSFLNVFFLYNRVATDCLAWTVGLVAQGCLVYQVRKVNQEQADLERRASLDEQGLMDWTVCQAPRVTRAYQVCQSDVVVALQYDAVQYGNKLIQRRGTKHF